MKTAELTWEEIQEKLRDIVRTVHSTFSTAEREEDLFVLMDDLGDIIKMASDLQRKLEEEAYS